MSGSTGRNDGAGKWSRNEELRNVESSIAYARKTAYDHQEIEKKRNELALGTRRKLIFPHLNSLLSLRARADDRERATQAVTNTNMSHNWNAQFRSGDAQGREDAETKRKCMKVKKQFYRMLYSEYKAHSDSVPSLSHLCIQTIAKNVQHYDAHDIKYALSTVDHRCTELLSLLSSLHGTLHDEQLVGLTQELTEKVFVSKHITDKGVSTYFAAMHNASKDHFSALDSWEQIELSEIHISSCMHLKEITLLSCSISTASLHTFDDCCRSLQKLCLHDIQFTKEADVLDPTIFCLQVFDMFAEGFLNLVTLDMLQCPWVRWDGVNLWSTHVFTRRQHGAATLPKLLYLTLSDFNELRISYRASRERGVGTNGAQSGYATTVVTQLIDYLRVNCCIDLTIVS